MNRLHQTLTQKYPSYNNWHQTKQHGKIHWGVFVIFTLLIFGTVLFSIGIFGFAVAKNNLFLATAKPAEVSDSSNFAAVESDFKNAASYDYHLNPSASMIDKGITLPEVTTDREGMTRPQGAGVDPGAYEYQGASPPPSAWLDLNSPLALNLHPRLLFIPQSYRDANPNAVGITVQEMRNKLISHIEYKTDFQFFINTMDSVFNVLPTSKTQLEVTSDAVNFAFLYIIDPFIMSASPYNFSFGHTRNEYESRAIEHARYIATQAKAETDASFGSWVEHCTFNYGGSSCESETITDVSLAIVNDWMNDKLSLADKQLIMDAFINLHNLSEAITPSEIFLFASGKHFGLAHAGAGVIGIYGDNLGSQYYRDQMDILMKDVEEDWIKSFKDISFLVFNNGSNNPQGISYDYIALKNMMSFVNVLATAMNENLFKTVSYLREHVYYNLFSVMPIKLNGFYPLFRTDDIGFDEYATMDWGKNRIIFNSLIHNLPSNEASLTKWMKDKFYNLRDGSLVRYNSVFYEFFQGDKNVVSKSPSILNIPLSKDVGMGQYMMRTGFENQSDSLVAFFAPKYHFSTGHAHIDFASFRISKYGDLAITRQIAKGFSGGNIQITKNNMFYNTIGVYRAGEFYDDGGSYNIMDYRHGFDDVARYTTDAAFQENGANHVGTVRKDDLNGSDYDYIDYDYSKSWDTSKVTYAEREFVYLRPQGGVNDEYAVVFDRVNSVSPGYTKYFLLHSSFEPETDGTFAQERSGKWVSTNSSTVKITNTWNGSHGRLFSKTLLPVNYKINKVGGPGYYWQDADGKVIYGGNLTEEEKNFRGTFTTQVQANTNQNYDNFLHVLQFGDANTLTAMNNTTRIDGDTMIGALINDPTVPRIVLFSKDPTGAAVSSATYSADYSSTLTGKHLLADITSGTYDVYKNGIKILTGIVSQPGKNTLSFESTGGSTFQIVKTGEVPPPTDTTPPIISSGSPTGILPAGITQTTLSVSTDENTTCKYGTIPNTPYASIANTFSITGTIVHSQLITGLTNGTSYNYYVRCQDIAENANLTDYSISFSVGNPVYKPSDLNQDTKVNQLDLDILKQDWNRTDKPKSDLNQDGIVDSRDLGIMMSEWKS